MEQPGPRRPVWLSRSHTTVGGTGQGQGRSPGAADRSRSRFHTTGGLNAQPDRECEGGGHRTLRPRCRAGPSGPGWAPWWPRAQPSAVSGHFFHPPLHSFIQQRFRSVHPVPAGAGGMGQQVTGLTRQVLPAQGRCGSSRISAGEVTESPQRRPNPSSAPVLPMTV